MLHLPSPVLFLVAASSLAADCWQAIATLEKYVFKPDNMIQQNIATCTSDTWYWLGITDNLRAKIILQDNPAATDSYVVMRSAQTIHNEKSVTRVKFAAGRYAVQLYKDNSIVRTIGIVVQPRKITKPIRTDKKGTDIAILIPENAPWMSTSVQSLLRQQQFSLVDVGSNIHVYQRNITMQWTIAVITYGNKVQDNSVINYLRLASEALILLERDDAFETVCPLDRVAQFMDFTVKGNSARRCSVAYPMLKDAEKTTLKQLQVISKTNKMTVGAAKVGNRISNQSQLEYFLLEWIVLPTTFTKKSVYLRLTFISIHGGLFHEEVARQFTKEILSDDCQLYAVTADPQVHVYVSCSAHSMWSIATGITEVFNRFPTLSAIQEVFISDISTLATVNDDLAEMKLEMMEDEIPSTSDTKFLFVRESFPVPKLDLQFPPSLTSSASLKHSDHQFNNQISSP